MARDFNENRNVNAVLKDKSGINAPGVYYAAKENADGFNVVSVSSLPSAELFIGQGTSYQDDITEWTLFNSQAQYGGIGANAFSRFPNLASITIWQEDTDDLLVIDDNAFYSNVELAHIYVHPDLLGDSVNPAPNTYRYVYAGKSFVSLFESYELINEWTIPTQYNGTLAPTTLTKAWLDTVTQEMSQPFKNVKTTIIVPDYFTSVEVGAFSGLGTTFTNATDLKFVGIRTLPSGFMNGATWCKHVWLDNGTSTLASPYVTDTTILDNDFRIVAPYNLFQNYFMQEHNITNGETPRVCPIIGYKQFVSGASMDYDSATGTYDWFSDIDFDVTPETLEDNPSYIDDYIAPSTAIYYCYDKTTTLVIQGSGALTSAMVESAINDLNTPKTWITKVVISSDLTLNTSASAGCLDICDTYLPNVTTLELNQPLSRQDTGVKPYTNISNDSNKFVNIIWNYTSIVSGQFRETYIKYFESNTITGIPYSDAFYGSKLEDIKVPNVTQIRYHGFYDSRLGYNQTDILFEKLDYIRDAQDFIQTPLHKMFLPKITKIDGSNMPQSNGYKLFIGTDNCVLSGYLFGNNTTYGGKLHYFKATSIVYYMTANNWIEYTRDSYFGNRLIGVIDGGDTYANIKNRGVSMNYPTLTGIDTEANIQLLTPTEDVLYLASDTGNLWQYSNGAWSNLFSGYTPTWYSDEDVSTIVLPSAMDISHTYYVKLTAI